MLMETNMNPNQLVKLITNGTTGVLCLHGDENGYPYSVPVSYIYYKNDIYIISEKDTSKTLQIQRNPKATFVVVLKERTVPQYFTVEFESILIRGTAEVIEKPDVLAEINQAFIQRFYSQFIHRSAYYMEKMMQNSVVIHLSVEEMTGKIKTAN